MPLTDEYRELIADVQRSVEALLDESHHDAWIGLRMGLGEIHETFAAERFADEMEARVRKSREAGEAFRRRREAIKRGDYPAGRLEGPIADLERAYHDEAEAA